MYLPSSLLVLYVSLRTEMPYQLLVGCIIWRSRSGKNEEDWNHGRTTTTPTSNTVRLWRDVWIVTFLFFTTCGELGWFCREKVLKAAKLWNLYQSLLGEHSYEWLRKNHNLYYKTDPPQWFQTKKVYPQLWSLVQVLLRRKVCKEWNSVKWNGTHWLLRPPPTLSRSLVQQTATPCTRPARTEHQRWFRSRDNSTIW